MPLARRRRPTRPACRSPQRVAHLLAVDQRHPVVEAAVGHQHRRLDPRRLLQRRGRLELRGVLVGIADQLLGRIPDVVAVGEVATRPTLEHQVDVGDADVVDAAAPALRDCARAPSSPRSRRTTAHDADALRVDRALLRQPVDAVVEVVLHRAAPLLPAGLEVLAAPAQAAAELGLQHRVAERGEVRRLGVPAPVPRRGRTARRGRGRPAAGLARSRPLGSVRYAGISRPSRAA